MFRIVLGWEAFKDWLSGTVHLTHYDLHLVLGLGLTFLFGWMLKKPLGSWLPWWMVFGLQTLNETSDFLRYYVSHWPWTPRETLIDYALTLVPSAIVIIAARMEARAVNERRRIHEPVAQPGRSPIRPR